MMSLSVKYQINFLLFLDAPTGPPSRPPPPQISQATTSVPSAPAPYPVQMQGMPQPMMGYSYMTPMPASYNPYATLPAPGAIPYPTQFSFPQAPGKEFINFILKQRLMVIF
jgi:hypothetical protein